jgi:hypothetical protein
MATQSAFYHSAYPWDGVYSFIRYRRSSRARPIHHQCGHSKQAVHRSCHPICGTAIRWKWDWTRSPLSRSLENTGYLDPSKLPIILTTPDFRPALQEQKSSSCMWMDCDHLEAGTDRWFDPVCNSAPFVCSPHDYSIRSNSSAWDHPDLKLASRPAASPDPIFHAHSEKLGGTCSNP